MSGGIIKLIIAFSFLAFAGSAFGAAPTWTKEGNHHCKVWDELPFEGAINPNYTLWWSGACKEGYASGEGMLQWVIPDKYDPVNTPGLVRAQYDGPMIRGKLEGKGKLSLSSGEKYTGDFADGQAEGYGSDSYSSGNRFVGMYTRGLRSGHGTLFMQTGDKHECEWKNDVIKDGFFIYDWADGDHFEGYEANGVVSGHGFLIDKTGKHEGEWVDGALTDNGVLYTLQMVSKTQR